jgi:hypothetical protein
MNAPINIIGNRHNVIHLGIVLNKFVKCHMQLPKPTTAGSVPGHQSYNVFPFHPVTRQFGVQSRQDSGLHSATEASIAIPADP